MELQYLGNSGFSIQHGGDLIVVDCHNPERHPDLEARVKMAPRVTVLASHYHRDHFSPSVKLWGRLGNVEYVFSDDIPAMPGVHRVAPGDVITVNGIEIRAYGSTDVGVSFMFKVKNHYLFHAGDLNNWHWQEESSPEEVEEAEAEFLAILKDIAADHITPHLAMFPVDPRMGTDYYRGAVQFAAKLMPRLFIPMHFGEKFAPPEEFYREIGPYTRVEPVMLSQQFRLT